MFRNILGFLIAVVVYVVFLLIVVVGLSILWPDYKSAGVIVNLIFLSIGFGLAFWVYNKISNKETPQKTNNDKINDDVVVSASYNDIIEKGRDYDNDFPGNKPKSNKNRNGKVVLGVIVVVVIFFAVLFILGSSVNNDVGNPNVFSDENISFKYPGDWTKGTVDDFYLTLESGEVFVKVNISDSEGYSLDEITDNLLSSSKKENARLLYKNKTNVNSYDAYDIGFEINNEEKYYLRLLTFTANDKMYIFAFESYNLEDIKPSFELIKKTIKTKN